MTTPLFILALLSVAGGVLGLPVVFHLPHLLSEWLMPVLEPGNAILAASHGGHLPHLSHLTEWILLGLGAGLALGCSHLAFHAHRQGNARDLAFGTKHPELEQSLSNAWGIDRAYTVLLVQPVMTGAAALSALFDLAIIDGAVNGLGRFAERCGNRVAGQANGHIAGYGLVFGGAAFALAAIWMWIGV